MSETSLPGRGAGSSRAARYSLRAIALGYLALLLVLPVGLVLWRTFQHGLSPVVDALTSSAAVHAFKLTLTISVIATACNAVFGVGAAILLVRHRIPGRRVVDAIIDLPMSVSPVVVGLALILVYGRLEPIGGWLDRNGVQVIFSTPGMTIATIFVSLPLVIRAVEPVLREIGTEQEQAAWMLGASAWRTFRTITVPSIRWALAYGIVLGLARSLGEYGAIAVVSGRLVGKTQTVTLFVEERFQNFDQPAAYAAASCLALIAAGSLIAIRRVRLRGANK